MGDFNSDGGEDIFILDNGLKFFNDAQTDEVTLWMQGAPLFENILQEFGFNLGGVSGGGWLSESRPMICRFNPDVKKYELNLNEKDWYFTMGDTLEIY